MPDESTATPSAQTPPQAEGFDRIIERLRQVVGRLEQGNLSLEQSLLAFEEGVGLSRRGAEILDAAERYQGGGEEAFRQLLYAPEMHDPDLIIRTSGERRLSNYLMWQSAYSELVFVDELWPDFDRAAFEAALAEYGARQRRFGGR